MRITLGLLVLIFTLANTAAAQSRTEQLEKDVQRLSAISAEMRTVNGEIRMLSQIIRDDRERVVAILEFLDLLTLSHAMANDPQRAEFDISVAERWIQELKIIQERWPAKKDHADHLKKKFESLREESNRILSRNPRLPRPSPPPQGIRL